MLALVEDLPTRTSGKVDRGALPWPLAGADDESGAADDLDPTAAWLAARWRELLGLPVTGQSDFFVLGGTSLAAAKLVSVLRGRCPAVSVSDVYGHPTLLGLAARLDELTGGPVPPADPATHVSAPQAVHGLVRPVRPTRAGPG